jgi:hypothetical protein
MSSKGAERTGEFQSSTFCGSLYLWILHPNGFTSDAAIFCQELAGVIAQY